MAMLAKVYVVLLLSVTPNLNTTGGIQSFGAMQCPWP